MDEQIFFALIAYEDKILLSQALPNVLKSRCIRGFCVVFDDSTLKFWNRRASVCLLTAYIGNALMFGWLSVIFTPERVNHRLLIILNKSWQMHSANSPKKILTFCKCVWQYIQFRLFGEQRHLDSSGSWASWHVAFYTTLLHHAPWFYACRYPWPNREHPRLVFSQSMLRGPGPPIHEL